MRKHALCRLHHDDNDRGHPISNKSCQTDILGLDKYLERPRPTTDANVSTASYRRPLAKKPKVRSVAVHCERRRLTFAAFKGYQKFKHVYKRKVSLPPPPPPPPLPPSVAPSPPSATTRNSTSADDCSRRNGGILPKLRPDRTTETEPRPAVAAVKLPMIPGTRDDAKPDCCSRSDDGGTRLVELQQQTRPQSTGSGSAAGSTDAAHRKLAYFRASSAPKVDSPRSYCAPVDTSPRERLRQQLQSTTPESSDTADTALDMSSVQQQTATDDPTATTTSSTATRTVSTSTTFAAEPVFPIVFSCESVLRHPLDGGYVSHTESHRFSVHYAPAADVDASAMACNAADDRDGSRSSLQVFTSSNNGASQNEQCPSADDSVSSGAAGGKPDDYSTETSPSSSAVHADELRPQHPIVDDVVRDESGKGDAIIDRNVSRAFRKAAATAVQLMSTTSDSRLGEHRRAEVMENEEEEKKDEERREKNEDTKEQREEKGDALLEWRARTEHTPLLQCDERLTQNRGRAANYDRTTVSNQSLNVDSTATTSRIDWRASETARRNEFGDNNIVPYAELARSVTSADDGQPPRELQNDNAGNCCVPTDENCNVASSVHTRKRGTERNVTNCIDDDRSRSCDNGHGSDEWTVGKQCRNLGSIPSQDDCTRGKRDPHRRTGTVADSDTRNRCPGEWFFGKRSSENGVPCDRGRWPEAADGSRDDGCYNACCCCCRYAGRYGTTTARLGCTKCSAGNEEPRGTKKTEDRNANDCSRRPKHRLESVDESAESSSNNNNYVGGFLFGNGFHAKPSQKDGFSGEYRERCEDGAKKVVNFSSSTPEGGQHHRYGYYHDYAPSKTGHGLGDEDCTVFADNRSETSGGGGGGVQQQTPYYLRTDRGGRETNYNKSYGADEYCKNTDSSDDSLTDSLEDDDGGCCKYEGTTAVSYFLALDGQKSSVTFTLKMPTTLESRLNRRHSLLKKHLHASTTGMTRKAQPTRVRVRHKGCQTLWTEEKGVQVQRGSTANNTAAVRGDDHNVFRTLLTGLERNAVSENQIRVVGGQKMVSEGNQTEESVEPASSEHRHVQTQTTGRRDAAVGPATPENDAKKSSADNALVVGQKECCKGKEVAAAVDDAKNREHVLTLSKGWINFYTLRADNADTEARGMERDSNTRFRSQANSSLFQSYTM